jgi:hypothetical protein
MHAPFVARKQGQFFVRQIFFCKKRTEVIVVHGYKSVPVVRNQCGAMRRKIQTKTEQYFGTLLQFIFLRHFMNPEFPSAHCALSASVPERIELGADTTVRAD